MKIDCYLSTGCASERSLRENIYHALVREGLKAEVNFYRISDKDARELGLKGSPSVFVDGREIQPANVQGFS